MSVLVMVAAVIGACTTHGDGGRCDPANVPAGTNQNADCDNGLVCISGSELQLPDGGGSPQGNFCCPPTGRDQLPNTDICFANTNVPGDDASIPDTGTTDTGTNDATTDQSASDGATDASDAGSSDAADADATDN